MNSIYLKKKEEKRIYDGSNLVYANEVDRLSGKIKNGELVNVYTFNEQFLGKGYINHISKVLVRMFIKDEETLDTRELFFERINSANEYRKSIGYSNSYRAFFSEADGIPGLIIDKYSDYIVIEVSSLGIDMRKEMIIDIIKEIFNPIGIYEKCEMNLRTKEGLKDTSGVIYGNVPEKVIIEENGLKISVDIINGQKTGYFLDQKENRFALRKYVKDKEVLDCFSNTGGFSLNAATVCKEVTAVDISKLATDNVMENAKLNGFSNVKVITDDVFEVLRNFRRENKQFDCIVLDPPAFCKSVSEVPDAIRGYLDINTIALKLVKKGGFLVSSSCSHYVTFPLFEKMLMDAAKRTGRIVKIVEMRTQAPDHPSLLLDSMSQYLKFYVLKVE